VPFFFPPARASADAVLLKSLDSMMKLLSAWLGSKAEKSARRREAALDGLAVVLALSSCPKLSSSPVRLSRSLNRGATRLKRGRKVTMDAQKMPTLGSITPYKALPTLSYVPSLVWLDSTTVRRRRIEKIQALSVALER
jgi:hypothetical protein